MVRVYIDKALKSVDPSAYNELINTLRMGLEVIEWDTEIGEPPDDGCCYIGFYELPEPQCYYMLPLLAGDLPALTALILNFAYGFIPTEIAAFRAGDDIVSRQRL